MAGAEAGSDIDHVLRAAYGDGYEDELARPLAWILQQPAVRGLCAVQAGLCVGALLLHYEGDRVFLNALAVIEPQRNKGVATALVRAAFDWALAERHNHLVVAVALGEDRITRRFEALGFRGKPSPQYPGYDFLERRLIVEDAEATGGRATTG